VVYSKVAYFTTFSPSSEAVGDPCFVGEGTAILYAMNYATGQAVLNFDDPTDLGIGAPPSTKSDRSTTIGTAIPSGVVVTVIGGRVTAYIGVGGGVYKPTLSSAKSLFPMTWKLVF
jgi:type IV pilus assembly protein PilY1